MQIAFRPRAVQTKAGAQISDDLFIGLLSGELPCRVGNGGEHQEHEGKAAPEDREAPQPFAHRVPAEHQRPFSASSQLAGMSRHAHLSTTMPSFNRTMPGLLRTMIFNSVGSVVKNG